MNVKVIVSKVAITFLIISLLYLILNRCTTVFQKGESHIQYKDSNLTIYVASDLHYISPALIDGGAAYQDFTDMRDNKEVLYIEQLMDSFIDKVKKDEPDVLILSGDLTINGEKKSHEDLAQKLASIDPSVTKVYVIPGNHDINNVFARGFKEDHQIVTDYITPQEFTEIYGSLGIGAAASKDKSSLSYLVKPASDFWILMIDSNIYDYNIEEGTPSIGGFIEEDTLSWIEACGRESKEAGATLITVTHQNLLDHNALLSIGYTIYNNMELLSVLKEEAVHLNFSGHIHCQDIISEDGVYDVASNALSVYPHKFGVLNITDTDMIYDTERLDVASWAEVSGLNNPDLLNYDEYTKNRFDETMSRIEISDPENKYTEEQKAAMTDFFKELNRRCFAGEEMTKEEAEGSDAYKWLSEQEGFLSNYIKTIAYDEGTDDNHLQVKR